MSTPSPDAEIRAHGGRPVRFGWAQVALGLALFAASARLGGPAWLLAWPALAVFVVGLGYLGLGPRVFGKGPDGRIALGPALVLLPYHVVAWLRVRWDALRHREAPWHEVAPGLFLGRIVPPEGLPPGTRVVVDLTCEFHVPAAMREGREVHPLPALDTSVPRYADFARLATRLAPAPGPIYVHCAAGHGRSATFAAALLVARGLATGADDAEAMLRRTRPSVRLHRAQRAMVDRYGRDRRASPP